MLSSRDRSRLSRTTSSAAGRGVGESSRGHRRGGEGGQGGLAVAAPAQPAEAADGLAGEQRPRPDQKVGQQHGAAFDRRQRPRRLRRGGRMDHPASHPARGRRELTSARQRSTVQLAVKNVARRQRQADSMPPLQRGRGASQCDGRPASGPCHSPEGIPSFRAPRDPGRQHAGLLVPLAELAGQQRLFYGRTKPKPPAHYPRDQRDGSNQGLPLRVSKPW